MGQPIQRALISVSDKKGIAELAIALAAMGVEIISTGGTEQILTEAGVRVTPIEHVTGLPEMLGGRVKTLHAAIHAGILADRSNPDHMRQLVTAGFSPIDLVVVNLYPFQQIVAKPDCTLEEAVENIDIGGPSILRSAAKNHAHVTVVPSQTHYRELLREMHHHGVQTTIDFRRRMMVATLRITAEFDRQAAEYFRQALDPGNYTDPEHVGDWPT